MPYVFKDKDVVKGLIGVYENKPWVGTPKNGVAESDRATNNYICQTPTEGIASRNGNQCGKSSCTLKNITESGVLEDVRDPATSEVILIDVFNPFSSPVGGDRIITAKRVFGRIIVDAEDCT